MMAVKKYKKPDTLKVLTQLDKELQDKHDSTLDDYLGFYINFDDDDDRYECTPEDAIIFGRTGTDGDHFAFLTNNGMIVDLEYAPIVFIQPMDFDNEVKLVARNIKEFISLYIQLKELYVLERFDMYKSESDFIKDYEENYQEDIDDREEELQFITMQLQKRIEIKKIENVYSYIKKLRNE